MRRRRHIYEDHTGDVRFRIEARTLPELFAEAGCALGELMVDEGEASKSVPDDGDVVVARASDRNALLAQWLNELIFQSETKKKVYTDVRVERLTDQEIRATIRGIEPTHLRTAVKAATLHGLAIERVPGGYVATVVLDV